MEVSPAISIHTPDPAASPLAGLSADAAAETERMAPAAIIDVIFLINFMVYSFLFLQVLV